MLSTGLLRRGPKLKTLILQSIVFGPVAGREIPLCVHSSKVFLLEKQRRGLLLTLAAFFAGGYHLLLSIGRRVAAHAPYDALPKFANAADGPASALSRNTAQAHKDLVDSMKVYL